MKRRRYVAPAIIGKQEGLPSYGRAYSHTCSFLDSSSARKFFQRHEKVSREVNHEGPGNGSRDPESRTSE